MDIDETIIAFQCCVQKPPDCAKCPLKGPGFGIVCRQMVRDSVSCWLKVAKESIVMKAPTVGGWISVEDEMPKQHKSIFAPWYGTKTWSAAMWKEESETVIVAGRFPDGSKTTTTGRLCDSKWETRISKTLNFVVTHWMPMPEPPREENDETD